MCDSSTLTLPELGLTAWIFLCGLARSQTSVEDCTVTANSQTRQVRSDGVYLIQNIPVGNGLLRVESTCIRDGVTPYDASEFAPLSSDQADELGPVPHPLARADPQRPLRPRPLRPEDGAIVGLSGACDPRNLK